MLSGNFPSKAFLIENYAKSTGFDMSQITWYEAFAYWKGAIIAQQLYQRYVNGASKDPRMEKFGNTATAFTKFVIHLLNNKS